MLTSIDKALTSALGVLLVVLTGANALPFLPSSWHTIVSVILAILTPIATYLVPNKPKAVTA